MIRLWPLILLPLASALGASFEDDPKPMRFGKAVVYLLTGDPGRGPWKYLGEQDPAFKGVTFRPNPGDPANNPHTEVFEADVANPSAIGIDFPLKAGDTLYVMSTPSLREEKRTLKRVYLYWRRFRNEKGEWSPQTLLGLMSQYDSPVAEGFLHVVSTRPFPKQTWKSRKPAADDGAVVRKALKDAKGELRIGQVAVTRSHGTFYTGLLETKDPVYFAVHRRGDKTTVLRAERSVEVRPVVDIDGDGVPEYALTADSPPACLTRLYPKLVGCL